MASTRKILVAAFILCTCFLAMAQGQINAKINHPRPPILQSAADAEDHPADAPVQTAEKDSRLDPSNFLVVLIAAIILIYSANRAIRPPYMDMSVASEEVAAYNEAAEAGEMQLHTTFMFVIVSSASLMLIFYFMSAMSVLITILFSFISLIALGTLVYPYVERITNNSFSREIDVPVLGPMPMLVFGLAPLCALVVFGWLITKSWILNNILAISLIVFFLTSVRLSSLMVAASLLILAFFYDIFWVFCSSAVFGKNVMVTVATGLDVPIKILVPLVLAEGKDTQFTLIGLGDIVLPGLLLCFAMRFDDSKGLDVRSNYFAVTMAGYCIGLTICEIIVGSFHWAQPAMIYLVPGTLIPFTFMAYRRGEVSELWEGIKSHRPLADSEQRAPYNI